MRKATDSDGGEKLEFKLAKKAIGRFRNPDYLFDRIVGLLKKAIIRVIKFYDSNFVLPRPSQSFPEEWQNFLAFLARNKIAMQVLGIKPKNDLPEIYGFSITQQIDSNVSDAKERKIWGHSFAKDQNEALSKAIGESLERYMLAVYRRKNFERASLDALRHNRKKVFPIRELAGFADWQLARFKNRNVRDSDEFSWVQGVELLSGKEALIPAQLIFWTYQPEFPDEPFLRERNTNGCAGHFSKEEAALAAICELVERDSFMIHWLSSISPSRLDASTIPDSEIRERIKELERSNFEVAILDTMLDIRVPSYAAILFNKSSAGPRMAIGGGAHPNGLVAIRSALDEAIFGFHSVRGYPPDTGEILLPRDYVPFQNPIGKEIRLKLWHSREIIKNTSFLIKGLVKSYEELSRRLPPPTESPKEDLKSILSEFKDKGPEYEIYAYYAEHPVLEKINYHVARIIIPALIPFYLVETNAPLGAKRIKEVPPKLGFAVAAKPNPWPHPFP